VSERDGDALDARFDAWIARAARAGEVWVLVDAEDFNTVLEDTDADRDLHMLFTSEADAAAKAEGTAPAALSLTELGDLLEEIADRGEALALYDDESWIVAEPGVFAESIAAEGEGGAPA
jgi:hypothetical protein